jgi:hypothetical protein
MIIAGVTEKLFLLVHSFRPGHVAPAGSWSAYHARIAAGGTVEGSMKVSVTPPSGVDNEALGKGRASAGMGIP